MEPPKRSIVIVGGGVVGCATAYFLTRHPKYNPAIHTITLLEAVSIAAAASGKAGGLLAQWAHPECIVPLSYRLHADLAREHGGAERWGYRRLGCISISAAVPNVEAPLSARPGAEDSATNEDEAADRAAKTVLPSDLDWINENSVRRCSRMGYPGANETSQVHPFYFTTSLAQLAKDKGVDIRIGARVTKINHSEKQISSVQYDDQKSGTTRLMDGVTDVVISAGPWTGRLLPRTKVEGLRAHSVVFDVHLSPYAVFTDVALPADFMPEHRARQGQGRKQRGNVDPEIYARPGNEAYACGSTDSAVPLAETADLVQCDIDQCDDLISYIATISPALAHAPVKTKQACYLPQHQRFGRTQVPLIGPTTVEGLWVASGHTCWGIQNGPGTGCVIAEMLLDGMATSADVSKLDPRKFKV